MRGEVILLGQHDAKTPSGGVTGNACAVNAATDDEQVKDIRADVGGHRPPLRVR
jgi:hypothetical protein